MPYARNGKARIYYEVEGEGPPLILQHGFGQDLNDWRDFGWVAALQNDFRLILIDARGHGASEMSYDPNDYRFESLAGDVVVVLDSITVEKAHFFGYSRGAHIGCALAKYAPQRVLSLILGGLFPHGVPDIKEAARQDYGAG